MPRRIGPHRRFVMRETRCAWPLSAIDWPWGSKRGRLPPARHTRSGLGLPSPGLLWAEGKLPRCLGRRRRYVDPLLAPPCYGTACHHRYIYRALGRRGRIAWLPRQLVVGCSLVPLFALGPLAREDMLYGLQQRMHPAFFVPSIRRGFRVCVCVLLSPFLSMRFVSYILLVRVGLGVGPWLVLDIYSLGGLM